MFYSLNVHASCNTSEFTRLKEKAKEIQFAYSLNYDNNSFDITATNLDKEIKVLIIRDYYLEDYREFSYNTSQEYTLSNFTPGERVTITFKGYVANECAGETVYTKTLTLPYYNSFYDSSECENYREFIYCKERLVENNISSSEFYDKYYPYVEKIVNREANFQTKIVYNFIVLSILLLILVLLVISIVIVNHFDKRKKDDLFK